MIIYMTKQTFERYKLKYPEELSSPINLISQTVIKKERGDKLLEWGAKLFYFDKRKCIQVVNFASKLTLFLIDVKLNEFEDIGNRIVNYLFEIYKGDIEMEKALDRMIEDHSVICLDKLTDKSVIATLNRTQTGFADDGYRFYDFIRDGILHSIEINKVVNFDWFFSMQINGKREYFVAGKKYRELMLDRYGKL